MRACLFAQCFQDGAGYNDDVPTSQLRSVRVLLSVIAFATWNSRVVDFSRAILKTKPLDRDLYVAPPIFQGGNPDTRWGKGEIVCSFRRF